MSTQLPPPKRQKLHNVPHERDIKPSKPVEEAERFVPNIVVQFKNSEDGTPLGPAINLPANTGRDALQMLVNKLKGEVSSTCRCCMRRRWTDRFCALFDLHDRMKNPCLMPSTSNLETPLLRLRPISSLVLLQQLRCRRLVCKSMATFWTMC